MGILQTTVADKNFSIGYPAEVAEMSLMAKVVPMEPTEW